MSINIKLLNEVINGLEVLSKAIERGYTPKSSIDNLKAQLQALNIIRNNLITPTPLPVTLEEKNRILNAIPT